MGQKSLSRLNRINVSMFWESGVIDNNYHWVGTKAKHRHIDSYPKFRATLAVNFSGQL